MPEVMEPKIETPQARKDREAKEASELARKQALLADLSIEEMLEAKRIREEKRAKAARNEELERTGQDKVLMYCIYHQHYIAKDNQKKKKEVAADNTVRYVPDPEFNHSHYQINNNRFWVPRNDLTRLRNLIQYRQEYIEAIDLKDGDPRAMSLEQMLETPQGEAWLANMVTYSKRANIRPPLAAFDVRQQIKRLRNGTEKPPKNCSIVVEAAQ